jgi:hypothetical protein
MSTPVLFNRRLREEEIKSWIDLVNQDTSSGCISNELASSFLRLPETIAFVSTIDDDIVGGTAIFRDRVRLGMVLSSVAIRGAYRESSAYHVIKTSLPFMKTAAIRDVDAIISRDPTETSIGFPASLELDIWMFDILEKMGFKQVGRIWSNTLECNMDSQVGSKERRWDHRPNLEGAKQLIWSQGKAAGLTTSLIWATLDFAFNRGTLRTYSIDGSTRIAASIDRINETALVGMLVVDSEYSEDLAVDSVVIDLCRHLTTRVHLPLIGESQQNLVDLLVEQMSASLRKWPLTLLRKNL